MTKVLKVLNAEGTVLGEFNTKKEAAEFLLTQVESQKSVSTVTKLINKSLKSGNSVFGQYKLEEEVKMEEIKNVEEVVEEVVATEVEVEETPEVEVETPAEEKVEETVPEVEAIEEVEETPAAKVETVEEKPEKQDEVKSPSKRNIGKVLIAKEDGVEFERFNSIKAATLFMKEKLGLSHMPFTPIMKSAREGIDWNQYSFEFENPEDVHIPTSSKKKESEDKIAEAVKETEVAEAPEKESEEVIEEIVEIEETI